MTDEQLAEWERLASGDGDAYINAALKLLPVLVAELRLTRAAYRERGQQITDTVAALRAVTGVDGDMGAQLEAVARMAAANEALRAMVTALEHERDVLKRLANERGAGLERMRARVRG